MPARRPATPTRRLGVFSHAFSDGERDFSSVGDRRNCSPMK
jgi:hypothetical protein